MRSPAEEGAADDTFCRTTDAIRLPQPAGAVYRADPP
jgi:hypothetical protein